MTRDESYRLIDQIAHRMAHVEYASWDAQGAADTVDLVRLIGALKESLAREEELHKHVQALAVTLEYRRKDQARTAVANNELRARLARHEENA